MNEMTFQVLRDAAQVYERLLVPGIFQAWTGRVTRAAGVETGQRVLDVACGTGALARNALALVGPSGSVTGIDVNAGMLAVAREIEPGIEWRQGHAESLPFDDGAFDVVVSQFGLMFFEDRVAALTEMARVLAPGGRMSVAVFDGLDNNPPYAEMVDVLARVVDDAAAAALASPFILGDTVALQALFERAGLASARIVTQTSRECFATVREMVTADVDGWFPLAGIHLDKSTFDKLVNEAQSALAGFVQPDGRVEFEASAHIVTVSKV